MVYMRNGKFWTGPEGSRELEAPTFHDNRHLTLISLYQTVRFTETKPDSVILSYEKGRWAQEQVWNLGGREKSLATTETRTQDFPAYIVVATLLWFVDKIVRK